MHALALALILAYGSHSYTTATAVIREPDHLPMIFVITVTWQEWPAKFYVRGVDLYRDPAPVGKTVRHATRVTGAGVSYIDTWDGSVDHSQYHWGPDYWGPKRLGVRVYPQFLTDPLSYGKSRTVVVEGLVSWKGRIEASSIRVME